MRFFVANRLARSKPASHLALAIALVTGTAVSMVAVAEPAHAQKKKKKKDKKDEAKPEYSEEFIAAYQPIQEILNAEGGDASAAVGLVPGMLALAKSPDEQLVAGNSIYNVGVKSNERPLQLQGMKLMLASGKVDADQVGRYNFVVYQLSNAAGDYPTARTYLQRAIDANFTTETVTRSGLQIAMSESFFSEGNIEGGLDYLSQAIAQRKASGQPVEESWYRRGLSVSYNNQIMPDVYEFVAGWISDFPSQDNWRDAINISRNLGSLSSPEMLDLMRLGYRIDTFNGKQEYIDYVDAADPRRLPKEVEKVIENGYATGRASRDDIFLSDSLATAKGRIAADRSDLPALERDAGSSTAALRTVVAAGDAFLSYDQPEKAARFYSRSLNLPGVDTAQVQTRLGIAQFDMGDFAAASETFEQVSGNRKSIAQLWAAYAREKAVPAAPVVPAVPTPATPADAVAAPTS
ncbi:MAG: hypothetical protein ABJ239_11565 [Erythrobacter sp.]